MKAKPLDLPTSGPVLRALAHDFDLFAHGDELGRRSVRRYLEGERVSADRERTAHAAVARALIEVDILPSEARLSDLIPDWQSAPVPARAKMLGDFVGRYARSWDGLANLLRQGAPVAFPRVAKAAALRLVTIDLATRLGALLWLMDWPEGRELPRRFLSENGPGEFLRAELKRRDVTRAGLADAIGVNEKTVDAWLDASTRPKAKHLLALVEHLDLVSLSPHPDSDVTGLSATLRRAYSARAVFSRCAAQVGPREAADLADHLLLYSERVCEFVRRSREDRDAVRQTMLGTLLCGTSRPEETPWIEFILRHLQRNEADPVWRTALSVRDRWGEHLLRVASKLGPVSAEEREKLAEIFERAPTDEDLAVLHRFVVANHEDLTADPLFANAVEMVASSGGEPAATNLRIRAAEMSLSDPLRAIDLLRRAIDANPADAEAHFRLGARLGQLGDIEASLAELRISVALRPQWDRARVEIAIVLANAGRHREALGILRQAEAELEEVTPWVLLHVAYELEQLDRWSEALAAYERYLAVAPRDGEALDRAAHLHLLEGDRIAGRRRAKEAAVAGIPTVLDALEAGYYGRRQIQRPKHASGLSVHFRPFRDLENGGGR